MRPSVVLLAGLFVFVPLAGAEHPQSDDGRTVAFDHLVGNEWWVEMMVTGPDADSVQRIHAKDTGGTWVALDKTSYGTWAGSFHIEDGHEVRFRATWSDGDRVRSCWFGHPDGMEHCRTTDARLEAGTYISAGQWNMERVFDVDVDASGNAYVAGNTGPGEFAQHDVLVTKVRPDGSIVWQQRFGGSAGDMAHSLDVANDGSIFVGGITDSTDFPANGYQTQNRGEQDGFVTKLHPDGSIAWSTLLGGEFNDHVRAVSVDRHGLVTVAGFTNSCDYPTHGTVAQSPAPDCGFVVDGIVTRLTADGTGIVYSTYYGGSDMDIIHDVVVKPGGRAHIVGQTWSSDLLVTPDALQPTSGGHSDAFYARFSPTGSLEHSTYLGGSQDDAAYGATVDGAGGIYLTGDSGSATYPTTPDALQPQHSGGLQCTRSTHDGPNPEFEEIPCKDIVVTRIDRDVNIAYSTFFGTQKDEHADGIARDAEGGLHVTGRLHDGERLPGEEAPIGPAGGYSDAYLFSIAPGGGEVERAARIGGSDGDFGEQTAVAPDGSVWVAGWTWSSDIPTTRGAEQRHLDGSEDGYLARLPAQPREADLTFDHRGGNQWWVEVHIEGSANVWFVHAEDSSGETKQLEMSDWGHWVGSFHIEPGDEVRFWVNDRDGTPAQVSCWFTHPGGETPDGGQTCGPAEA